MTTIHHAHQRTSLPHVKKTALQARRPVALARALSSTKLGVRGGRSGGRKSSNSHDHEQDSDENGSMATSFLQFCAMCEKQIIVPNNSILYCSESCRRKDGSKSSSSSSESLYALSYNSSSSTLPLSEDAYECTTRVLVPSLKPTVPTPYFSKPPLHHHAKSDLDPTEWKPKLPHRPVSEASRYLAQFHHGIDDSNELLRRGCRQARSTASASTAPTGHMAPSLSHTPLTTSSISSTGSFARTPHSYVTPPRILKAEAHSASTATMSITYASAKLKQGRSVPLSTVKATTTINTKAAPAGPIIDGRDFVYTKKSVVTSKGSGTDASELHGSLKRLLSLQGASDGTDNL